MTPTTYSSFLRVPGLLDLQHPTDAHDELLFVVIHQSHELWFKLLLHELDESLSLLESGQIGPAFGPLKRMVRIWETLVPQWSVLDTMTPAGYEAFRGRLESGSGFQSSQFREIEFASGLPSPEYVSSPWLDESEVERLRTRLRNPTLRSIFLDLVDAQGLTVDEVVHGRTDNWVMTTLAETLTDYDEAVAHWRHRHVLAVERQIGSKPGTGGSSGVGYLRSTTTKRFFPELWSSRTSL